MVDDAIVVVENVERNIENGLSPREATYRAMKEVFRADHRHRSGARRGLRAACLHHRSLGTVLSSFALTIAISTVISAINSLTLSPALAALLLKDHHAPKDRLTRVMDSLLGWFFRGFNRAFGAASNGYGRTVGGLLGRKSLVMVIYLALVAANLWHVHQALPGGFVPAQDKQYPHRLCATA